MSYKRNFRPRMNRDPRRRTQAEQHLQRREPPKVFNRGSEVARGTSEDSDYLYFYEDDEENFEPLVLSGQNQRQGFATQNNAFLDFLGFFLTCVPLSLSMAAIPVGLYGVLGLEPTVTRTVTVSAPTVTSIRTVTVMARRRIGPTKAFTNSAVINTLTAIINESIDNVNEKFTQISNTSHTNKVDPLDIFTSNNITTNQSTIFDLFVNVPNRTVLGDIDATSNLTLDHQQQMENALVIDRIASNVDKLVGDEEEEKRVELNFVMGEEDYVEEDTDVEKGPGLVLADGMGGVKIVRLKERFKASESKGKTP